MIQDAQRVAAHDPAAKIAIAVAGAGAAFGDVAHDRAGIAAQLFRHLLFAGIVRLEALGEFAHVPASLALIAANTRDGVAGNCVTRTPDRVADGVEDRRRGRDQHMLAEPLGAERSFRVRDLDQDRLDRRHVADGRDQIVVKVFGAAWNVLFHQRHADALRDAALDLAFGELRVDRLADVMRGGDLDQPDRAELQVDFQFGDLRAIAIDGVGAALALGVERCRRRIVCRFSGEDIAEIIERQVFSSSAREASPCRITSRAASREQLRLLRHIGEAQDLLAQVRSPRVARRCR